MPHVSRGCTSDRGWLYTIPHLRHIQSSVIHTLLRDLSTLCYRVVYYISGQPNLLGGVLFVFEIVKWQSLGRFERANVYLQKRITIKLLTDLKFKLKSSGIK